MLRMKYFPLTSQRAPSVVPSTVIEQPGSVSPVVLSLTTPEIFPVVPAKRDADTKRNKALKRKIENFLLYLLKGNPPLNTICKYHVAKEENGSKIRRK